MHKLVEINVKTQLNSITTMQPHEGCGTIKQGWMKISIPIYITK